MQPELIWPNINAKLQANEIKVWLFESPVTIDPACLLGCRSLLTPAEQAYADQKAGQAQQNCVVKQAFLRHILAQYHSGCAPTALSFSHNQHGKPFINSPSTALRFNLSHSGQWNAVAVCLMRNIGVDVEVIKPARRVKQIAQDYFHPQERDYLATLNDADVPRQFYSLWTLKEALVKAAGVGMSQPFNQFSVVAKPTDGANTWQLCTSASLCSTSWAVQHFGVNEGVSLAIAVEDSLADTLEITVDTLALTNGAL
ncbi:4'-phosphopantetheinyl transferase family protein [Alteromonas flava]|uniref:4'-phosphopantetheinyl transferase family protein n=1 Tax=Alteromonas flava TaxID=2048003 RepID=UPI000C28E0B8|nr:4'-phosphopantetheinyl transferase superfamily protein [Alteromonas flava]